MSSSPVKIFTLEGVKISLDVLEDISGILPAPVAVVVNLIKRVIVATEAVRSNQDLCEEIRGRLLRLLLVIVMLVKESSTRSPTITTPLPSDLNDSVEQLRSQLEIILKEVEKIQSVVTSKSRRHKVATYFLAQSHTTVLKKCSDDLEWAMHEFDVSSRLLAAVRLFEVSRNVQGVLTNQFLESLPRAKYAAFDCQRPDRPSVCFEGTRTRLLEEIFDWVVNLDPTIHRFFWLKGIAGVGKTTVACSIAELARKQSLLGGQFCFSRKGEAELRNPALVFPTISYQLARFDPSFCERITAALRTDPEAPYAGLKEQLERLIINPLTGLQRDSGRIVLVVFDAFDECEASGAKEILHLLVSAMPILPFYLKILVTSRPEQHIHSIIAPSTHLQIAALHDIEKSIVKGDIRLYLQARLRSLQVELDLPSGWVTDEEIDLLAEKAGALFIYVETSLRFLRESVNPRTQLQTLVKIVSSRHDGSLTDNPFAYLDDLYLEILCGLITRTNGPEVVRNLQLVLGSLVLLRDPLSVDALERLAGLPDGDTFHTLCHLQSVILPPGPPDYTPRVYHPSFPDFLQDRCLDERFRVDTENHEARMGVRCLELLAMELHDTMLSELNTSLLDIEVENLKDRVRESFSAVLQYACRYWASHVAKARTSDHKVAEALDTFFTNYLLDWMKAMSWLGEARLCLTSLESVIPWVAKSSCSSLTKHLLNDGHRLILAHFSTISQGAQHITHSVFPFLPRNVAFLSQYGSHTDLTVTVLRGVELAWPACLMVLAGHTGSIYSVLFSPDGSRLASASSDHTLRLWDATSGGCLATLEGHTNAVKSTSFSPDGSRLASGSVDNTVRVWDATTGVCVATLEGHSSIIESVAFSPDGARLASGAYDRTIRVWDTATRSCDIILEGHTNDVISVTFSSDGTRLASGSDDCAVRVWAVRDGKSLQILKGHSDTVYTAVFSPDGSRVASASSDRTVRMWDVAAGTCLATLRGHTDVAKSLSFAPNSRNLASCSADKTIRIWDSDNYGCITTFHGHAAFVNSVSFSPNSSRLASASEDTTIRIWDPSARQSLTAHEQHRLRVTSVTFSSDGTRLASAGPWDAAVRIWDATTGDIVTTIEGPMTSTGPEEVIFSPDTSRLAFTYQSVDGSNGVQVSDSSTGGLVTLLQGDFASIAFSPNGSRLASGHCDHATRVWDVTTGECLLILEGHQGPVTSTAFFPDGVRLASGSDDTTIRIWDSIDGSCLTALQGHPEPVTSLSFTPDGSAIISESSNGDILSWTVDTYVQIYQSEVGGGYEAKLEVKEGRLVRMGADGTQRLICILPPSVQVLTTDFFQLSSNEYRVALGCQGGSVVILAVRL